MSEIRTAIRDGRQTLDSSKDGVLTEIVAALGKVSSTLTVSQQLTEVTPHELNFAMHCLLLYGSSAQRFSFGPHHTDHGSSLPPSGFQFRVHQDAPMLTAPFNRRTIGNGVLAFPLDAGFACMRTIQGSPIDEHHFLSSRVRAAIDLAISDGRLGGDERNYAGIFTSRQRSGARVVRQYWAVVQANDEPLSRQFFAKLEEAERQGKTWLQTFSEGDMLGELVNQQRMHRAKVLCALLHACDLGPVCEQPSLEANARAVLDSERSFDNVHDIVEKGHEEELAYLNGMASNRSVTSAGLIVREAGRLGVSLLAGPLGRRRNKRDVGFPCWTGHQRSPFIARSSGSAMSSDDMEATTADRTFFWDNADVGDKYRHNLTLSIDGAHVRQSARWRTIESWLGHPLDADDLTLEPVVVKLHSTEPPRSFCNGACSGVDDDTSCEL